MDTAAWLTLLADAVIISYCAYFIRSVLLLNKRAPFVPTRRAVTEEIAGMIGSLPESAVFYDLGCGDARMLSEVAKRNPSSRYIGIELQRIPYLLARIKTAGTAVQIRRGDLFSYDLSDATHLYAYLYNNVLDDLLPKLKRELKQGTLLYALDFKFTEMQAMQEIPLASHQKNQLGEVVRVYRF